MVLNWRLGDAIRLRFSSPGYNTANIGRSRKLFLLFGRLCTHWIQHDYGRLVSETDDSMGVSKINSFQNGHLVRADIHKLFD